MTTNHDPVERVLPYRAEDLENTVTSSSGNVYADLGYENPEEMLLKAHLVMLLSKAIKAKGLIWVLPPSNLTIADYLTYTYISIQGLLWADQKKTTQHTSISG
jgi:hypothetical protein